MATGLARVVAEPTREEAQRAVARGAREALRFLSAIHQADRWARGESKDIVPPAAQSLPDTLPPDFFIRRPSSAGER